MESNFTPSSGQDSTTNSQSSRSKIDLTWEHVMKKYMQMEGKFWCVCIAKGGGIHRMKKHLVVVKGDIRQCKFVPPDIRFLMENSLQEFVRCKQTAQKAYECKHSYGPNVSQFEGDIPGCEKEVQQMRNLTKIAISSGKRKKNNIR